MSLFLSGAMVVAFAPAVAAPLSAEALTGGTDKVKVHFDLDGGAGTGGGYTDDGEVTAGAGNKIDASGLYTYTSTAKNGYDLDYWWYDYDGDGKVSSATTSNKEKVSSLNSIVLADSVKDGDTVTLVAKYKEPAVTLGAPTVYQSVDALKTAIGTTPTAQNAFTVTITANTLVANRTYTASLTNGAGKEIWNSGNIYNPTANLTYNLQWTTDETATKAAGSTLMLADDYTAGDYTLTLAAATGESVQEKQTIVTVTLGAGKGTFPANATTQVLVAKGTQWSGINTSGLPVPTYLEGEGASANKKFLGYAASNGTIVLPRNAAGTGWGTGDSAKIDEDTTLTAEFDVARVSSVAFANNKITYGAESLSTHADVTGYRVDVTGPNGLAFTATQAESGAPTGKITEGKLTLGSETSEVATVANGVTKVKPGSGTYTVTVTPVLKGGSTETATPVSRSVEVVALTLDAGAGKIATSDSPADPATVTKTTNTTKAIYAQSDTKKATDLVAINANESYVAVADDATLGFVGWSTDGTKAGLIDADTAKNLKADTTLKAYYEQVQLAEPTVTVTPSADGKSFKVTATGDADSDVYFVAGTAAETDANNITGKLQASGYETNATDKVISIVAKPKTGVANKEASEIVVLKGATATATNGIDGYKTDLTSAMDVTAADQTDLFKALVASKAYTDLATDGEKALKANGYLTPNGWAEAANAQLKKDIATVIGLADAELDKLAAGTADATTGKTTSVDAGTIAKLKGNVGKIADTLDAAIKAVEKEADGKDKAQKSVVKIAAATDYGAVINAAFKSAKDLETMQYTKPAISAEKQADGSYKVTITPVIAGWSVAYTVNGGEETAYTEPFAITSGGNFDIQAWATKGTDKTAVATESVVVEDATVDAAVAAIDDIAKASTDAEKAAAVEKAAAAFGALSAEQQAQVPAASQLALATAQLEQAKKDAADPAKNAALKEAQANYDAAQKKVTAAIKATTPAATVKAGKKKLTVKAAKGTLEKLGTVKYQYRVKKGTKAGGSWKTLKAGKTVTVKKLAKGKKYTVQVKATVDGTAAKTFKKTVKVK